VAEIKEPAHAANKLAFQFKEQRRLWFRERLVQLGVKDADGLALQLQILADGAIAAALVRGDPKVAGAAQQAARVLLEAAGVKLPGTAQPYKPHPEERPKGASRRVGHTTTAAHPSRRRA
jgi:hypothetical protein